jgi:Ni/Co efflux regulator RcnB
MQTLVAMVAVLALLGGGANKPTKKGDDKKGETKKEEARADTKKDKARFEEQHREAFYSWGKGRGCPPGLAKKNNGCLPPGQAAKRYTVGKALAPTVKWYAPPDDLLYKLGPAPAGYKYAMVDGDLLTLAIGTSMVVDALSAFID